MSYTINSLISAQKEVAPYEKRLSICITSNGFSFSITSVHDELLAVGDVECNMATHMSELISNVKDVMAHANIQPLSLHDCQLVVDSSQFVWIPQHLYDESRQRSYLETLCKVDTGCSIYSSFNKDLKAYIVFSADDSIVSAFKIAVPGLSVTCQHDKMVNAATIAASDLKSLLLVNIRQGRSDYAVFCNKNLQLSNTYGCANFDEVVYHALNLTKQFRLEDAMMVVAVCGDIDRERFALLRRYFPNVALYTGRQLSLPEPQLKRIHTYRHALILS